MQLQTIFSLEVALKPTHQHLCCDDLSSRPSAPQIRASGARSNARSNESTASLNLTSTGVAIRIPQIQQKFGITLDYEIAALKEPCQHINASFPSRNFGSTKKSFQQSWFSKFSWLHYQESADSVYCHVCIRALVGNSLVLDTSQKHIEKSLLELPGYSNWKNALDGKKGFKKHEQSAIYQSALSSRVAVGNQNVANLMLSSHTQQKQLNRAMLIKVTSSIAYLAKQGLAFRGDWDCQAGSENNSNHYQLLQLREDDENLLQ